MYNSAEAKFIVSDWGVKSTPACSLAGVDFIPPVRDYEFGYRSPLNFT